MKWVWLEKDEQRNERAFGTPAGSETIWSIATREKRATIQACLRGRHMQTSSSNSTREGSTGSARMTVVM